MTLAEMKLIALVMAADKACVESGKDRYVLAKANGEDDLVGRLSSRFEPKEGERLMYAVTPEWAGKMRDANTALNLLEDLDDELAKLFEKK